MFVMGKNLSIAVVGAGLGGLLAALRLCQDGHSIQVSRPFCMQCTRPCADGRPPSWDLLSTWRWILITLASYLNDETNYQIKVEDY